MGSFWFSVDRRCYRCNNYICYKCNRKDLEVKRIPKISESEWAVMKALWKKSPLTANEIVETLTKKSEWKKETVRTFINRLVQKKAIGFEKKGREYHYFPLVGEEQCVLAETKAAGADFEALAKKYSEDGSAPRGGDLGLFDDKRMVKPFTEAAFSMEVGQVSDLVETQYGLHIIKVEEIQEAEEKQLADVKLEIAKELMKDERAPDLARTYAETLLPVLNGTVTGADADALLAEKSLTVQSSGEFSRKDRRIPKLGVSKDALSAAFDLGADAR